MKLVWSTLALALVTGTPAAGAPASVRTVTQHHNGKSLSLARGDTLRVELEANGTTGFGWEVAELPRNLKRASDRYDAPRWETSGPPIAGQGGTQRFTFAAKAGGRGTLRLAYRQPWDRKARPARSFRLWVVVR